MRGSKTRGFTLLEVMVVVAIVAIMGTIGIVSFTRMRQKGDMRDASSAILNDLRRARSIAKSGAIPPGSLPPGQRTMQAGIRIQNPTTYTIFVDNDGLANGTEADLEVVNIQQAYGPNFQIVQPAAPAEIRFRRNGTLNLPANVDVVLQDNYDGSQRTITVTYGGSATFM